LISLAIREEHCTKDDVAISLMLLADIYIRNDNLTQAEDYLIRTYKNFKET
jgi:hypothetical protein